MAKKAALTTDTLDGLLKSLLVLSRTVNLTVETAAVEKGAGRPLSNSKVQVLRLLARHGSQTSSQIARFLGVTKPAVSQIIDAMVHDKLVVRKPSKVDRREVGLELAGAGRQKFQAIRREQYRLLKAAVQGGKGSVKSWTTELRKIAAALASVDRGADDPCLQCNAYEDDSCVFDDGEANCAFLHNRPEPARVAAKAKKAKAKRTSRKR